jgi:hypothetical protein
MSRWRARRIAPLVVALALVTFSGAEGGGVLVVPFPPFFNASPPPPRAAPQAGPTYLPQPTELMPRRSLPPGQCYTPAAVCPLSDQRLVGHPCSCDTKTGRVAGRALIPPSVSGTAQGGRQAAPQG